MEQKAKRKFNIVDVIIVVLLVAVVGFAAHKTSLNIRGSPLISIVFSSLTGIPNPR